MRNRPKSTDNTRQFIDERAESISLQDEEVQTDNTDGETQDTTAEVEVQDDTNDSWLDNLTPYETPQAPQAPQTPAPQQSVQTTTAQDDGTDEQKQRLAELYAGLEHVDEDVAQELHNKLIAPEIHAMRAELNEYRQQRQQEQQARQTAILADVNSKINAKYKRADKILQSKEFMDFVNSKNNPYSSETEFDILSKAYYAGDANYVIGKIDDFVSSRGKPKPPVGAEPHQGGSGVIETRKRRAMTDAEYIAKRKAIKSAPKGTYPPNALRDLVNEYLNSRG